MTAERWTQIRQLFDTAMEQPAGNRELYVRELSNQDSELREDALGRFKHEIQLARTVTHPNVCRIFDLHRHHDVEMGTVVTFLTMELVEGETLSVYLARRPALTAAEALPIAEQIALALSAAHQKH